MDIQLALDLDGVRTAAVLAERDGTKIVIATGFPQSTIDEARLHVTPCAILRKPFDEQLIIEAMNRCLGAPKPEGRPGSRL